MAQLGEYGFRNEPCQQGTIATAMPAEIRTVYGNTVIPMGVPLVRNGGGTGKVRVWTTIVNGPICGFSLVDQTAASIEGTSTDANLGLQYPVNYPISMMVKGDMYLQYKKTTPPANFEQAYIEQGTGLATNDPTNGDGAPNQPIGYFNIEQTAVDFPQSQLVMTHVDARRSGTLYDILTYQDII